MTLTFTDEWALFGEKAKEKKKGEDDRSKSLLWNK